MSRHRSSAPDRSALLDLLRIGAIALVLVAHFGQLLGHPAGDFFGWKNVYYVSLGGVGVSIFLLLSGLLASLTQLGKPLRYGPYLWKKAARIYPIYWLTLPLTVGAYLVGGYLQGGLLGSAWPEPFPNGLLIDLAGSLSGCYAWLGLWGGPYNPPSWFIGLIMSLYALFPLMVFGIRRWPLPGLAVLFAISLGSRLYVGRYGVPGLETSLLEQAEGWVYRQFGFMPGRPVDWFAPCRVFEFGLGIYLGLRLPRTLWYRVRLPRLAGAVGLLSELAFPLFLLHSPFLFLVVELQQRAWPDPVAIATFMALMLALALGVIRVEQWLRRQAATARRGRVASGVSREG